LVEVARQDYANALTDLRNQMGIPETAGTAEPLGEFVLPRNIPNIEDQALIQLALQSRPEIQVARAQVNGACAAVRLAKGDRIPTPIYNYLQLAAVSEHKIY
jgi:cobalt-zinc-cadmium efflux system outer membrane protein